MAEAICRRLKLPARDVSYVKELVGDHMRFTMARRMREAKLKRFFERPTVPDHLELHRLDCAASHGKLETHEFCRAGYARFLAEQRERPPGPLLTGDDLIGMGFAPGPLFGAITCTSRISPIRPLRTSSQPKRQWALDRCCVPYWNIRP